MSNRVDSPSKVEVSSPVERRALLEQLLREKAKRKAEPVAPSVPAHRLFTERAQKSPHLTAITGAGIKLTYAELNEKANRLATFLKQEGVKSGSLVAAGVDEPVDLIVCLLGILKAGGVCLPVDLRHPRAWTERILRETKPDILLVERPTEVSFDQVKSTAIPQDRGDGWSGIRPGETDDSTAGALAFVVSPGRHCVAIEHPAVSSLLRGLQEKYTLSDRDRVLFSSPPDHENLIWQILWPLVNGATIVIPSSETGDRSGILCRTIREEKVTVLQLSATELTDLVASTRDDQDIGDSLRTVLCSGGILPRNVAEEFAKSFSGELHYCFGLAETTGPASAQGFGKDDADGAIVSIGHPLAGSVYLLDQGMQLVPLGVTGEICIGSDALARGYLHDDELTARCFVANPFTKTPGARLFRTGNFGRRSGDGRIDLVMQPAGPAWVNGFRVEPGLTEAALLDDPAVGECVVLVRDEYRPRPAIVAYIVPSGAGGLVSPEKLREGLAQRLPQRYLPDTLIPITVLPLTSAGEVDEAALIALEVIDQNLAHEWERALQSRSGVGQVAVVLQPTVERRRPLHLTDLLPPANRSRGKGASTTIVAAGAEHSFETAASVDAFSDGGPLVIPEDAPATLTRALIETAALVPDRGITFVNEDGSEDFQSYALLLSEARCVLSGLKAKGFNPGDRAILQIRSLREHFSVFWGCVLGGITPVTVAVASAYDATNAVANKLYNVWQLLGRPPILASESLRSQLRSENSTPHE